MHTRLIIMRHAKSSCSDASLDDHERPLNKGRRDAPRIAQELYDVSGYQTEFEEPFQEDKETLELMEAISRNSTIMSNQASTIEHKHIAASR